MKEGLKITRCPLTSPPLTRCPPLTSALVSTTHHSPVQGGNNRLSTAQWLFCPFCPNWKWKVPGSASYCLHHIIPNVSNTPYQTTSYNSSVAIPNQTSKFKRHTIPCTTITIPHQTTVYHTPLQHTKPQCSTRHHSTQQLSGFSDLFVQTAAAALFTSNGSCF